MSETSQALAPVLTFLQQHAPFSQMSSIHLEYLAMHLHLVFYAENEAIIGPQDGPAQNFYIIKQGLVRGETLSKSGQPADSIWELEQGECFPIGALLTKRAVYLQQRASESTICYELKQEHFEYLLQQSHVFQDFCSRRLASLLDQALHDVQISHATLTENNPSLNSPLKNLIKHKPFSCQSDTSIKEVLETMQDQQIASMVVVNKHQAPIGIFTLHDMLSRVTLAGMAIDRSIDEVMSKQVYSLSETDYAHDATLLMADKGISHICLVKKGKLSGVISEKDLFSLQRVGLSKLSRLIPLARNIHSLSKLSHTIPQLIDQLFAQGSTVRQLTQIIARLNDNITHRVIEIILKDYPDAPEFVWLAFGSEGRSEQTLKTDQDNGIIFYCSKKDNENKIRKKLLPIAKVINQALERCGFPLCPGNIMASNPECCLSLKEWQSRFSRWIEQGTPEHLLQANIFFDFRPLYLHGNKKAHNNDHFNAFTDQLDTFLLSLTHENSRFRLQMAQNAMRIRPPLGLFRDFQLSKNNEHPHALDLKLNGLTPFVDAARIISLKHQIKAKGTHERFLVAADMKVLKQSDVDAWTEAYDFIQLLRMKQHKEQVQQGVPLHNYIDPDTLNELNRRILKESFRQARKLQSYIEREYQL
ncbi:MAG: DUF294 nucleotidyltransferase-like domain-containing protein [Gammaproteobacteria bacterium]|nr:DUF294 nucleotidyltransferase-like domain-containing protein [Gammaproteobacteria bacterium]